MRIAIVGAGGVGGLLGALLLRGGHQVSFVARGAQLQALRAQGLSVEGAVGTFSVPPPPAAEEATQLPPADAVLVAVKAWQVSSLAPSLAPLLSAGGFAVPLQNGVEARDRLAAALGPERVVGGLCHMISWIERPGLLRQTGPAPSVTVGEWSGGGSPRLQQLCEALSDAGISAAIAPRVQDAVWEKALFVEALGAVGAAARLPVGSWRAVPESRALLLGAMRETDAVARACGSELGESAVGRALARIDALPPEATASMQRDLAAGRPSELDDQTGAIVRIAQQRGVAAPLHVALLGALAPHERAARAR
jgi:2-dehydropantoate 2-reductase